MSPRPKAIYPTGHRKTKRLIPPGVQDAVRALALGGEMLPGKIAQLYGVDVAVVRKLAESVSGINVEHVAALKRSLPGLMTIAAVHHVSESIERAHSDPSLAAKSMFAAKMAVEAGKMSLPGSDRPGMQILNWTVNLGASTPPTPRVVPSVSTPLTALDIGTGPEALESALSESDPLELNSSTASAGLHELPPEVIEQPASDGEPQPHDEANDNDRGPQP